MQNEYTVIGLMSGTSLDGLDIAACRFIEVEGGWQFEIIDAITKEYSTEWKSKLFLAHQRSGAELARLNAELGQLHGNWVKDFLQTQNTSFDFIASHGHTVFHQPEFSFTTQIGSAPHIAIATNIPVIADFRTIDVARGGQGAPLVPIGDLHLFKDYDCCLNLGGVANVSIKKNSGIEAFDICICNMALNFLAQKLNMEYDANGAIAASGTLDHVLFDKLNAIPYFNEKKPKSLGKEFFEQEILQLIDQYEKIEDAMHTFVEHVAFQIARSVSDGTQLLITGGGAYNAFLIERIKHHCKPQVIIPDDKTIQFKEALIFAFLGVLRMRGENNCLASVTGASTDSVGGAIYLA